MLAYVRIVWPHRGGSGAVGLQWGPGTHISKGFTGDADVILGIFLENCQTRVFGNVDGVLTAFAFCRLLES